MVEEFMIVGVFETTFVCFCDWCSEGREDDYVVCLFLEDLFGSPLDEAGHCGGRGGGDGDGPSGDAGSV